MTVKHVRLEDLTINDGGQFLGFMSDLGWTDGEWADVVMVGDDRYEYASDRFLDGHFFGKVYTMATDATKTVTVSAF